MNSEEIRLEITRVETIIMNEQGRRQSGLPYDGTALESATLKKRRLEGDLNRARNQAHYAMVAEQRTASMQEAQAVVEKFNKASLELRDCYEKLLAESKNGILTIDPAAREVLKNVPVIVRNGNQVHLCLRSVDEARRMMS